MVFKTDRALLSSAEASRHLKVSVPMVRRLARNGSLATIKVDGLGELVTLESVRRYERQKRTTGRGMSPKTAWGVLALLSGETAPWLSPMQASRARKALREMDPEQLAWSLRHRAEIHEYWADNPEQLIPEMAASVATGRVLREYFGITFGGMVEGYVDGSALGSLVERFWLDSAGAPNVRLHVVPEGVPVRAKAGVRMSFAVCAVDLIDSGDPREHAVGVEKLAGLLAAWRSLHA